MAQKNIVIIGAGPAGVSTALSLSGKGYDVYLVDEKPGGNYSYSGSVVSNAFLYQSYLFHSFKERVLPILNIKNEKDYDIDFKKVKRNIDTIRNKLIKSYKEDLEEANVNLIEGKALFTGENKVELDFNGAKKELKFHKAVIATGSIEKTLKNINCSKMYYASNIFNLEEIPKSIAILGGGFIGCEYATFFKRLGCEVKIIEKDNRLLKSFDEQIVKRLEDSFKKDGIKIFYNKNAQNIEKIGNKTILFTEGDEKIESEAVFVAIGRKPNLDKLNLETTGVKCEDGRPVLDSELRTTNRDIYIVGDATGGDMLVNWAHLSSEIVSSSILNRPIYKKTNILPKVAYLDPEIASVGYTDEEATKVGFDPASLKYSYSNLEKSLIMGYSKGFAKIIYDKNLKRVLGAHIIGKGAAELISMFTMIIQAEIKIDQISEFIFNHPTFAEVLAEIGSKAKSKN
ncbi:MAG: Dihydrolipoyl dehydrogenase [Deferribacteraceae bacterium]|jgi:dihydrolipoamide dehydrogenase|nr:Dihydrolipoyl dehydrogenase [Deferribacteraceae bacterium]